MWFSGIIPVIRLNGGRNGLDNHCLTSVFIEFCIGELFMNLAFSKFCAYAYMCGPPFDLLMFFVVMPGLIICTADGI